MDEFYTYDGVTAFDWSGNRYDVYDLIARGIDVVGAATSNSPYFSPDDPRFRNRGGGWFPQAGYPSPNPESVSPGSVNRQGVQINFWFLLFGAALLGAFAAGRKGR